MNIRLHWYIWIIIINPNNTRKPTVEPENYDSYEFWPLDIVYSTSKSCSETVKLTPTSFTDVYGQLGSGDHPQWKNWWLNLQVASTSLEIMYYESCITYQKSYLIYICIYIYIVSSPNNKTSHCTTKFQKVWLVKISFVELFGTYPPLLRLPRSVIFITTVSSPRFVTPGASSCWTDQGIWCNFLEEIEMEEIKENNRRDSRNHETIWKNERQDRLLTNSKKIRPITFYEFNRKKSEFYAYTIVHTHTYEYIYIYIYVHVNIYICT